MVILEISWATRLKNNNGIKNNKIMIIETVIILESVVKLMGGGI